MTHAKRPSQSSNTSTSSKGGTNSRQEIERLIGEIRERVANSPDKAAKILTNWIHRGAAPDKKKRAA